MQKAELNPEHETPIAFTVSIVIVVALFIRNTFNKWRIPMPYSFYAMLFGLLIGLFSQVSTYLGDMSSFKRNVVLFLYFYTPAVMFKAAFFVNLTTFKRAFLQIIIISVCVFIVNSLFVAVVMRAIIAPDWSFATALQFGISCAPVYPMDVVVYLKQLGTYTEPITILLEGEAFCGLASAIVMTILNYAYTFDFAIHWYQFVCISLRFIIVGAFTGLALGYIFCFLMRTFCFDVTSLLVFAMSAPFITFNVVAIHFGSTGAITVIILALFMANELKVLPSDAAIAITNSWDLTMMLLGSLMSVTAGLMTVFSVINVITWRNFGAFIITYLVTYIGRLIGFLLFAPILRHLGVGFSYMHILIFVWGGIKSRVSLGLVQMIFPKTAASSNFKRIYTMHTVLLFWFSLMINGTTIPLVCSMLKLSDSSLSRQVNMNNCMMYIYRRKHRSINILKTNPNMAEINWKVIIEMTSLRHPYDKRFRYRRNEVNYFLDYDIECYPGVQRDTIIKRMKHEIRREDRTKLMDVKKLFYAEQLQQGLVSSKVANFLASLDNASHHIKEMMLELDLTYAKVKKENVIKRMIRFFTEKLTSQLAIRPPQQYRPRLCYHFIFSRKYHVIKYIIIILHLFTLATQSVYKEYNIIKYKTAKITYIIHVGLETIFYLVDLSELIIVYMAHSRNSFFRSLLRFLLSFWNLVQLTTFAFFSFYFWVYIVYEILANVEYQSLGVKVLIMIGKLIRLFEILSFFNFWNATIFRNFLNRKQEANRRFTYEMGSVYLKGEMVSRHQLAYVVQKQRFRADLRQESEENMYAIKCQLVEVMKEYPWISTTIKTRVSTQHVLNTMMLAVKDLKWAGWLSDVEYLNLEKSITMQYKHVVLMRRIEPYVGRALAKDIPWMSKDANADYLFDNAIVRTLAEGDTLCKRGRQLDGIYVIISGLFSYTFQPDPDVLKRLTCHGCLPVIDIVNSINFQNSIQDFVFCGGRIGEIGVMTRRNSDATVFAISSAQVLFFRYKFLKKVFQDCLNDADRLQNRIWKEIGIHLAFHVLNELPVNMCKTTDELKLSLYRGFIPNLSELTVFDLRQNLIDNVVLLEGIINDLETQVTYIGPCSIPKFVTKIDLTVPNKINLKPLQPILMIIPKVNVPSSAIMNPNEAVPVNLRHSHASNCLYQLESARNKYS